MRGALKVSFHFEKQWVMAHVGIQRIEFCIERHDTEKCLLYVPWIRVHHIEGSGPMTAGSGRNATENVSSKLEAQ